MIAGRVVYTRSLDTEIRVIQDVIDQYAGAFARYLYVHDVSVEPPLMWLPEDFEFVAYQELLDADKRFDRFEDNLIVVRGLRITKIPDKRLGVLQRSNGFKLYMDSHPFCSKADVWYSYFAFSLFDKNLLGYPHSYAFRDAPEETDPYNVEKLAAKVAEVAETDMPFVFDVSVIRERQVALTPMEVAGYQALREELFETANTPLAVVNGLKRYVDATDSMQAANSKMGLNLSNLARVWDQYNAGTREIVYSTAKVDAYLREQFWTYVQNANNFIRAIGELHGS